MWLEIKTDLRWVVVGVEGENRNKLGACQLVAWAQASKYKDLLDLFFRELDFFQ